MVNNLSVVNPPIVRHRENGRVYTTSSRTLAIVGSHPATVADAPWDDPNVEIWLFNEAPQKPEKYPRWDACLQIHDPVVYRSTENWVNKDHWEWLQQDHGDRRIFMQDVDPMVPNSVKYPLDEILAMIPFKYLRSSPAMALALGVYYGYSRIELYGSELSSNTEYSYQAINYGFWIGFALGRGIDLHLGCWRNEFDQLIYGFDGEFSIEKQTFLDRHAEIEKSWSTNRNIMRRIQGNLDDAILANQPDKAAHLAQALEKAAGATGECAGAMAEALEYSERAGPVNRQEFERRSAQAQIDGQHIRDQMLHETGKMEYVWNVWKLTGKNEAVNQFREFLKKKIDLAHGTGYKLGVMRENQTYMTEYDDKITAAVGAIGLKTDLDPYRMKREAL